MQSASRRILSLESIVEWFAIRIMKRHSGFGGPEANFYLKTFKRYEFAQNRLRRTHWSYHWERNFPRGFSRQEQSSVSHLAWAVLGTGSRFKIGVKLWACQIPGDPISCAT